MLEWKYYRSGDILFPFVAACVERRTGHDRTASLTKGSSTYLNIVNELTFDHCNTGGKPDKLQDLKLRIPELKKNVM